MQKAILVQGGDGTAIPAGMVGEVITAATLSANAPTFNTPVNFTDALSLTAGTWEIFYHFGGYMLALATAGIQCSVIEIRNITDNVKLVENYGLSVNSSSTADNRHSVKLSAVVTISGTKEFRGRGSPTIISGTPTAVPVYSVVTGNFYAIRRA